MVLNVKKCAAKDFYQRGSFVPFRIPSIFITINSSRISLKIIEAFQSILYFSG